VPVGDSVVFDLNLSYTLDEESWLPFVKGARASISILNVADKVPARAYTANSVFNPAYSNPFGRTITFQISAGF